VPESGGASEFVSAPIASPTRSRATTLQASASLSIIEPDANGDGAYESLYLPNAASGKGMGTLFRIANSGLKTVVTVARTDGEGAAFD
jgi:hypothetical protein